MAKGRTAMKILPAFCLSAALFGCAEEPADAAAPGSLALSLASEAGGVTYRLHHARFILEGPARREFGAGDESVLVMELPAGAYMLTLLDGFTLMRAADAGASEPTAARLVSANPAPVLVTSGQTTQLSLRFELASGASSPAPGRLAIDLAIADAASDAPACALDLRINELDYEQVGSDEAEFIEIVNRAECAADLAEVALELINGGDGKVYARYELAQAAASLAGGARLVLADPAVLSALPAGTPSLPLNGSGLQNGPDGVRLLRGAQVLDALAYEGAVPGVDAGASAVDEAEQALGRCPDGFDSGDPALDLRLGVPSPGGVNACES
jgi:hypothetical protein